MKISMESEDEKECNKYLADFKDEDWLKQNLHIVKCNDKMYYKSNLTKLWNIHTVLAVDQQHQRLILFNHYTQKEVIVKLEKNSCIKYINKPDTFKPDDIKALQIQLEVAGYFKQNIIDNSHHMSNNEQL